MKKFINNLCIIIVVVALSLFILDQGLRILGRLPSNISVGELEQFDDSYRMKRNFIKLINWPSFTYYIITNSFGFRDYKVGDRKIKDKEYIVFLGDSMTFAQGVDYKDSFVGVFHDKAKENCGYEVLNMGIGGHHIYDQQKIFYDFIEKRNEKPSHVIICMNEHFVYLFENTHKNNFIKDGYLFNKKKWKFAYLKRMLDSKIAAYSFFRNNLRAVQTKYVKMKKEKSIPYLDLYSKKNRMSDENIIKKLYSKLNQFDKYCDNFGVKTIYVYIPTADSFHFKNYLTNYDENINNYDVDLYEKIIKKYCENNDKEFYSLKNPLEKQNKEGHALRFKTDGHFNNFANKVIGEYLFKKIIYEKFKK